MKINIFSLLILFLLSFFVLSKEDKIEVICHKHLMKSYLLHGRDIAKED